MSVDTVYFDNAGFPQTLFTETSGALVKIESQFEVQLVARDNWVRIEGQETAVQQVKDLLGELERHQQSGVGVRERDLRHAIDAIRGEGGSEQLRLLRETKIQTSSKKSAVYPKTRGQREYIDLISKNDIAFGIGPAGTGKTYLAMAMAVQALKREEVARIILTRPAVEAGEALGFLPGDLQQKIAPYLRPLHDALHDMLPADEVQRNMDRAIIEIAPLAYMRGRTLNHAFIILDEAQNCTREQMFMFLTRLGYQSKAVITGDPTQIDLPSKRSSGIVEAREALKGVPGIGVMNLSKADVVRHPLVQRVIEAYERHREIES